MTTLIFPLNPTVGQQYVSDTGTTWTWDGVKWIVGQLVSAPVVAPPPPPPTPPTPTPPTTVYDPLLNLSFPINPSLGQLYTAPDGVVYRWAGNRWTVYSSITVSAPAAGTASQYVLPKATSTTLGGVKVGAGIDNNDGTISVNLSGLTSDLETVIISDLQNTLLAPATTSTAGLVKVGSNINVNNGTISVPQATNSTLGVVKAGTNVNIDGFGAVSVAKGAGINTVADIPDVNTTSGGAGLNDGALLVYNASNNRWDTVNNLRSDQMDGGFF